MPTAGLSVQEARAGVSLPLTNLAQGVVQPKFVMPLLYPLARVSEYGGATIRFDDSIYDAVIDNRADGANYPEVQFGYSGGVYKLEFGGLSIPIPHKRRDQMIRMGINPGEIAVGQLINKVGLAHEIQCATVAVNPATYAASNRVILGSGSRFGDATVDPDPIIRTGKSAIANQIGLDPNIMIIGRNVLDVLCARYAKNFTSSVATTGPGLRQQLNTDDLAAIFGFDKIAVCDAIFNQAGGARGKVFGNHVVMARTNEAAIGGTPLPYKPQGNISMVQPSFGYTYVIDGHPQVFAPFEDKRVRSDIYQIDFDRQVQTVGTNQAGEAIYGYLIQNAV